MKPPEQFDNPANGQLIPRSPEAPPPEHGYGYGYGYEPSEEPGGGTLLDYWHILKRRKGTLILVTFLGGLLAVLFTLPQTRIY